MTVTIKEIASRLDVSEMTVSKVLNGAFEPVRPQSIARADRIRQLADQLGYRPNAAARTTRTGRFGAIGLLLSTSDNRSTLSELMFNGIQDRLAVDRLNMLVVKQPDETLTDATVFPRLVREACCDGLLIDYTHGVPHELIRLIERHRLPAIWLNNKRQYDCVHPDDQDAGRRATRYLLELGHRRIAYADYSQGPDFPNPHYSAADRRAGYEQAMQEAGLTPLFMIASQGHDVPSPQRVAFSRQWLATPDRPTAIVSYSGSVTVPIFVAAVSLGLKVPGDLSIISMDDRQIVNLGPAITCLLVPQTETGRVGVEMLLNKIDQPQERLAAVAIPFTFSEGGSCEPYVAGK